MRTCSHCLPLYEIIYSLFSIQVRLSHPASLSAFMWMQDTRNFTHKHCKHAHTPHRDSSLNLSISFLFSPSRTYLLPTFSLQRSASHTTNVLHIIHTSKETHTGTHTQGSLVGGGHGCSSSAQSQSGSRGSAASCLPASPGGIHSN